MRATKRWAILSLLLSPAGLAAQNSMTSSPYSMFGIGEIASGLYGQTTAMAGVSIGMRERMFMNLENPAGLTALDSCTLLAEASAFAKSEHYQSGGSSNNAFTGNFSAFAVGGRIRPRWYASAGVTPYSFVGYYFTSQEEVEGTPGSYYTSTYEGNGGLSKAYLSQAYQLTKHFSVGVNLNYIFGNMTQTETQGSMIVTREMSGSSFHADLGLQYHRMVGRETFLTVGAVYGYKQGITLKNTQTVKGSTTETEYKKKKVQQYLPQYIGVGASVEHKKMTYGLDYMFRQYSALSSGDSRVTFSDAHEWKLGLCYFPDGYSSGSYWKRVSYKMGVSVSTPYMRLNGQSGLGYRVSAGLGLPVLNGRINAALYYDHLQLRADALRRGIIGFTVTYTLGERFHKVKL